MAVISNRKYSSATLHFTANATIKIAGNNSVSNVAIGDEVLTNCSISRVIWGNDAGCWLIKSANSSANSVIMVCNASGPGVYDLQGNRATIPLMVATHDSLHVELNGAANGFIIIEVKKVGSFPSLGASSQ